MVIFFILQLYLTLCLGYNNYRGRGRGRGGRYYNNYTEYNEYDEHYSYRGRGKRYQDMTEEEIQAHKLQKETKKFEAKFKKFQEQFVHHWRKIEENLKKLAVGGEVNVLLVAQGRHMARTVANILSKDNKITEFNGLDPSFPVYCFESKFKDFIANVKVTSVNGNLYTIDFETSIDNISDPKDLFEEETRKSPKSKILCENIQKCSRKADALVLWTESGPQGENICFEIIKNLDKDFPEPINDFVFRAKFKSLSISEVSGSFDNLKTRPIEHLSLSYDALNTIDLKIRSVFSTYLTREIFDKYPILESMTKPFVYDT